MMMKISNKLRNKIRKELVISSGRHLNGEDCSYIGDLEFSKNEVDIWFEAFDWLKHIEKYFQTSYNTYKIDCGRFKGIYPIGVYTGRQARFFVYSYEDESWKDWFIMEGEGYAPIKSP